MSKSYKNSIDKNRKQITQYDDEDDYQKTNFKERRLKRRLVNALHSKNIEELIHLEEDYE